MKQLCNFRHPMPEESHMPARWAGSFGLASWASESRLSLNGTSGISVCFCLPPLQDRGGRSLCGRVDKAPFTHIESTSSPNLCDLLTFQHLMGTIFSKNRINLLVWHSTLRDPISSENEKNTNETVFSVDIKGQDTKWLDRM